MAATYHDLSAGSFTEDWSGIGRITVNDDWSLVPSIVGFRGDNLTAATGVDPQTVLGDSAVVNALANQTNPNTFNTGGVAEFEIADPTIALNGSGTADAPYIVLYMNSTGRRDVTLSFNARDIDGSGDDTNQQIAVQYRTGPAGTWTNLPAGYISDASTGPNLATLVTPVSVALPPEANDLAQLEIRIISTNAPSNDEWIGLDDIVVASAPIAAPLPLGPGAIAFTGFNADGNDDLAFVALVDIPAGTVVTFEDNEWNGAAFADTNENAFTWTADAAVAAGTVVQLSSISAGISASVGTAAYIDTEGTNRGIGNSDEVIYAFTGSPSAPTFLTAVANGGFSAANGVLTGTGLTAGVNALDLSTLDDDLDVAAFVGARSGQSDYAAYGAILNNPSAGDWQTQDGSGDQSADGAPPDVPFSTAAFTLGSVSPGSVSIDDVSLAEGDAGTQVLTFTVTRSGGTAAFDVDFATADGSATTAGLDYVAASGTLSFADGELTKTLQVTINGDTVLEPDQAFQVLLSNPTNGALIADGSGTGTIVNDDLPALGAGAIAFTGFNADGNDDLAFVALVDIPAGTTITFEDNEWDGAAFADANENAFTWTADSDVAAGTVVQLSNISSALAANVGTAAYLNTRGTNRGIGNSDETIYAYIGPASNPVFLTAAANGGFSAANGVITGTGLTAGVDAVDLSTLDDDLDIAAYVGARSGQATFADYGLILNNPTASDWLTQDGGGDQSIDGTPPDVPFSNTAFVIGGPASAGSISISDAVVTEGNSGTVLATFTVTRTGGTAAFSVDFFTNDGTAIALAGDYEAAAGTLSFADGEMSKTIDVVVNGDTTFEPNESFVVYLQAATNGAIIAGDTGTGVITNDDVDGSAPPTILPMAQSLDGQGAPTATNAINLVRLGAVTATGDNTIEGGSEVVAFEASSARFFSQNTREGLVQISQMGADGSLTVLSDLDIKGLPNFGGANSIAVKNGVLAVAYNNTDKAAGGYVALYDTATLTLQKTIQVGVGPDQLVFTHDGGKLLTADEGEAISDVVNPDGSVSIIDLSGGVAAAAVLNTISFTSLNGMEAELRDAGLQVYPGHTAGADFEPEYITISPDGTRAYVTLQEVSGVAVIDLTNPTADRPLSILPAGYVDHTTPGNAFDPNDQNGIGTFVTANIRGLIQPDAIASFDVGGVTYFITANEGDSRVGTNITDSARLSSSSVVLDPTAFPDAAALKASEFGRLNVFTKYGDTDGDGDIDQLYTLGGRGVSIFRQNADGTIDKVRETGGEFEQIIYRDYPAIFNQNQGSSPDGRSDDKGPEPEGVTIGAVGGRLYAFVALERTGGIMVYDVTDPANASFVQYRPPIAGGDNGPEVVTFVSAADSPTGTPLLLSANEISGTTTVYAVSGDQQVRFDAASVAVSQAEGDAGTTAYVFTVERTGGVIGDLGFSGTLALTGADAADFGGVLPTFSGVIPAGSSSVQVTINVSGDTVAEANESFQITLSTASNSRSGEGFTASVSATQAVATATIANDDITHIYEIQGSGHLSALAGQVVTTQGVVTAVDTNGSRGFYIQDPDGDGDASTSDGIFIFLPSGALPTVGHLVAVTGRVTEFTPSGAAVGALSTTELTNVTVTDLGVGPAITATQIGGVGGLLPPTEDLVQGALFYESMEGMLVKVVAPKATGPTNSFGEIFTTVDNDNDASNGRHGTNLTPGGNLIVEGGDPAFGDTNTVNGDFNPERIQIDDDNGVFAGTTPKVNTGAVLNDVTGIMRYDFGNYEVIATHQITEAQASPLAKEVTTLVGDADHLTVAAYNAENLDPGDGAARFDAIAAQIIDTLKASDIVSLQEVQDSDGPTNSAITSADITLQTLVDKVNALATGGAHYAYLDNPFIGDDTNGGEPGGNIRTAFIYRDDRLSFVAGSLRTLDSNGAVVADTLDQQTNPDNAFFGSRPPLVADFLFNGQVVTIVNVHFTSKGGSSALIGSDQPPFNAGEVQRAAQAQAVNNFVDSLLASDPNAKVVLAGDFNEFGFEEPMSVLKGLASISGYDTPGVDPINATATYTPGGTAVVEDLQGLLSDDEHFDYVFEGNSQSLDHILATQGLMSGAAFDVVRINADFWDQTSDHDPLVARFLIPQQVAPVFTTPAAFSTPENTQGIAQLAAADGNGDAITYAIAGGADASLFSLNGANGILSFLVPADYETPEDAGADNVYDLTVSATDSTGLVTTQAIQVTVTDVAETGIVKIGGNGIDHLVGTTGGDTLKGGNGDDTVEGGDGDDDLVGGNGNDVISGGRGNDKIDGGNDQDQIDGGAGDDVIQGENGNDSLTGGLGDDKIRGGNGVDWISGGDGNDDLSGNAGDDTVLGGDGDDKMDGGDGKDLLDGGDGDDKLMGEAGDDTLVGGDGDDVLAGNAGDDTLIGGAGVNWLEGSTGKDTFVFGAETHVTTVEDFKPGDVIKFTGGVFANFGQVSAAAHQAGQDTVIDYDSSSIILQKVQLSSLLASDFLFT